MDLDAEMERLSREARQKLEAERREEAARPAGPAGRGDGVDLDAEALDEARRLAARPEGSMSLGGKVAVVLVGLVAAAAVWSLVLAPLLKLAFLVAIVAGVVWLIVKLVGDDDEPDDEQAA